jgi:hypothetical protein
MLLLTRLSVRRANVEVQDLLTTKDHAGDGRRIAHPWRSVAPTQVKPIDSPDQGSLRGYWVKQPLASGMAAREGEDPHAGLQRSRQPGPRGGTPNCSLDEPANTDNGGMRNNGERHILWAKLMQAPEIGQ